MKTIILERHKVYKIKHYPNITPFEEDFPRDYIICSPRKDIKVIDEKHIYEIPSHFIVCFDGTIINGNVSTSFRKCDNTIEQELNYNDLQDIKEAMTIIKRKYNRKLNKIVSNNV